MTAAAVTAGPPATQAEKLAIYAAGLVQGIVLVTFPAASTIFTAPGSYHLSSSQYGTMFVPQVITAITASLAGATTCRMNDGRDAGQPSRFQPTAGGPWRTRAIASAGVPRHQPSASIHQVSPARM